MIKRRLNKYYALKEEITNSDYVDIKEEKEEIDVKEVEKEYAFLMKEQDKLATRYSELEKEEDEINRQYKEKLISKEEYLKELEKLEKEYTEVANLMEKLANRAKELQSLIDGEERVPSRKRATRKELEEPINDLCDSHLKAEKELNEIIDELEKNNNGKVHPLLQKFINRSKEFLEATNKGIGVIIGENFEYINFNEPLLLSYSAYISFYKTYLLTICDKYRLDIREDIDGGKKEFQKARKANNELLSDAVITVRIMKDDLKKKADEIGFHITIFDADL